MSDETADRPEQDLGWFARIGPFCHDRRRWVLAAWIVLLIAANVGAGAMGMAFNWQGNWSGLYRGVELTATGPSYLDQLWLHPNVDAQQMVVIASVGGPAEALGALTLDLTTAVESRRLSLTKETHGSTSG
mgnify:CR=1 FL=1